LHTAKSTFFLSYLPDDIFIALFSFLFGALISAALSVIYLGFLTVSQSPFLVRNEHSKPNCHFAISRTDSGNEFAAGFFIFCCPHSEIQPPN
jgi:hypothetical protein